MVKDTESEAIFDGSLGAIPRQRRKRTSSSRYTKRCHFRLWLPSRTSSQRTISRRSISSVKAQQQRKTLFAGSIFHVNQIQDCLRVPIRLVKASFTSRNGLGEDHLVL